MTKIVKPTELVGNADQTSEPRSFAMAVRHFMRGWRGPVIAGVAIVIAGLWLSWNWLVALGLAPIILALAPCAAMCALGLCMMGRGRSINALPSPETQQRPTDTKSVPGE